MRSHLAAPSRRPRRALDVVGAGALGLVALAVLAACSSSSGGSPAAAAAAPMSGAAGGGGNFAGRTGGPAASGLIAAVSGSTLQVQSRQDGQVAVTWSASTTFTQQVTVPAASIEKGDCVTAVATSGNTGATSFTASTIRVTAPENGACGGGFGGGGFGGGGFGGGRPGGRPSGAVPSGAPSDGAGRSGTAPRTGTFASGAVVSVSGSTLVVAARQFERGTGSASGAPSAGSTPTTVDDTVTIGASTTITGEQTTTSAAATVGRCATAQGKADSTGAVAATSIALADAVDGACTGGLGGFGRPGGGASGSTHG